MDNQGLALICVIFPALAAIGALLYAASLFLERRREGAEGRAWAGVALVLFAILSLVVCLAGSTCLGFTT